MNVVLEILNALACVASVWSLLLELHDRWREYRHQRMTRGDMEETGGLSSQLHLAPPVTL